MPAILFLDADPEDQPAVRARFPDAVCVAGAPEGEDIVKACADAEIISTFVTVPFPRSVIEQLPKLKLLVTRSVGFDHIDVAACRERGIEVCNVPDYGSHVIAEHVFALLLSTLRHIPEGSKSVESGAFDYHGLRGVALKEKTIGILGTGRIGRRVARIAHGFDMKILAVDQCRTHEIVEHYGVQYVSLEEVFRHSDIITLHVPATPDTEHMLNDTTLATLRDGAILVNTARGSLIDSHALLRAVESGKVGYALLDVLEHEKNFEENRALVEHPRVVVTPHVAFYADDSMRNMYDDCFDSIDQYRKGQMPAHVVHPITVVCDLPGVKKNIQQLKI